MTKESLAAMLNKREYGKEITREEAERAKTAGLVVVFGYSDDNMEFRGAIDEEVGCYNGGVAYVNSAGLFDPHSICDVYDEDRPCQFIREAISECKTIEAVWCAPSSPFCWTYETDIPHVTFDILEDGEPHCRGVVIDMEDL